MANRRKALRITKITIIHIFLLAGAVMALFPFFWMLKTSLATQGEALTFPPKFIPTTFIWDNYKVVWKDYGFSRFLLNTSFYTVIVTVGSVFASAMAAYAFSRIRWRGRNVVFLAYLGTLMIPYQVTLIPRFIIINNFGWVDTWKALIVPDVVGGAFGTFLLRQFFLGIPHELDDAAIIDGCGKFGVFYHITLPLGKTALVALGLINFIGYWNNYIWPLVVTNSERVTLLTVALSFFIGHYEIYWPDLMAGTVISVIPIIVIALWLQRYFVRGIALSGLKY